MSSYLPESSNFATVTYEFYNNKEKPAKSKWQCLSNTEFFESFLLLSSTLQDIKLV